MHINRTRGRLLAAAMRWPAIVMALAPVCANAGTLTGSLTLSDVVLGVAVPQSGSGTIIATPAAAAIPAPSAAPAPAVAAPASAVPGGGPITPMTGMIRAFAGDIDPHTGMIRAFGSIQPYTGMIRAFGGELDPQTGMIRAFSGDIDPYTGMIRAFWGDLTPVGGELSPQTGMIRAFSGAFVPQSLTTLQLWAAADQSGDYTALAAQLQQNQAVAATQWGQAVTAATGQSFATGFANPFYTDWNIDPADPATLARLDAIDRQLMMLDWYDELLTFSGLDRVDHWMNEVNWSPALTQTQQSTGTAATIGLVDFFAAEDSDVASKVVYQGGYQNIANPHGGAVGSLMVASHDGQDIMGIAPNARIAAYNPFDATMTANWDDVRSGIVAVTGAGASVVNLSLGVSGQTLPGDWRGVFSSPAVNAVKDRAVYVIAAGNDGVVQPGNIEMNGALGSTFLVVGSVDPNGRISTFSNTPGTACITDGGSCTNAAVWNGTGKFATSDYLKEGGLLMNRFLVAPGELILVSDGQGGVTRMSGTSFAAPLVSGAIALMQDRWPWLKSYPREVARIILESAQDLGDPGVDATYGHGLLDIEASQAPLDFSKLRYVLVSGRSISEVSATSLRNSGVRSPWTAANAYFTAFETVGGTQRDFLIPLSDRLFNSSIAGQNFQTFVYERMMDWIGGIDGPRHLASFTDMLPAGHLTGPDGWNIAMRGRYHTVADGQGQDRLQLNASVELRAPDDQFALSFGRGDGALSLGGTGGLQMTSDFNPQNGGANPLLGFASGGAHVATALRVGSGVELSLGVTRQDRPVEQDMAGAFFDPVDGPLLQTLGDYHAVATNARISWRASDAVTVSTSFTHLQERGAFLGVRSLNPADFGEGTASDGVTMAMDAQLARGLTLFASGTASNTASRGTAALAVDGTLSTAFQLGLAREALLGRDDRLRVSLAQPLTVERGTMRYGALEVIDRETGETGIVQHAASIGAPEGRRLVAEAIYGTGLLAGSAALNLFGSAELRAVDPDVPGWTIGSNLRLGF